MPKSVKKKISNDQKHFKFSDALSLTAYGKFNIFVLFATGGCLMAVIMETMGIMFVIPIAECDLKLSLAMKGYLSGANFLGVVSSSHLWGFLGDTFGRRKIIILSTVSSFIVTVISSIVPLDWMLILLRFINGLLIGGASAVVYAYSGEFHDDNYRPKVISWMSAFVAVGNMVISGLAWIILPGQWGFEIPLLGTIFKPWRLLIAVYGIPSIIFATCIFLLPESPKYLLTQGKETEALLILRKMYTINTGKSSVEFPVIRLSIDEDVLFEKPTCGLLKLMWRQTSLLFNKRYITKTFMVCTLQFGVFMATSGFYMWYPEIMNRIAIHQREYTGFKTSMCEAIEHHSKIQTSINSTLEYTCKEIQPEVFTVTLLMGAFFTVTYLTIGSLINVVGKKKFLLLLFVISASSGLAAQYLSGSTAIKIFMAIALISSTTIGVINAIVVDIYPTHVRAMALAISLMVGRFGAVSGSHVSGLIFYGICNFAYPIFAAFHIVLLIIVFLLPIPTNSTKRIEPIT